MRGKKEEFRFSERNLSMHPVSLTPIKNQRETPLQSFHSIFILPDHDPGEKKSYEVRLHCSLYLYKKTIET